MSIDALLLLACGIALVTCAGAGWGPGLHVQFATDLMFGMHKRLKRSQVALLKAHTEDFVYGNIAADIINFKRFGGTRNSCHHWNMRERMEAFAETDHQYAFLLGYLCHLAADTVAHNHFVPYQLLHGLPPPLLGHTYWEARADGAVAVRHWQVIDRLRRHRALHLNDQMINQAVRRKALSLTSNRWIFRTILLARSRKSWRAVMDAMRSRRPVGSIDDGHLQRSIDLAVERMFAVFEDADYLELTRLDPSGLDALRSARRLRRSLIEQFGSREAGVEPSRTLAREHFGLR